MPPRRLLLISAEHKARSAATPSELPAMMARLNLADAPGQRRQELLPHVIPQAIGKEDACAGMHCIEPRFLPAGQRAFSHPLLEQFGSVAQPRLIGVGHGRLDRLQVGGLDDRSQSIQRGGIRLPAPFCVCLDHLSERPSGQRSGRRRRQGCQVLDGRSQRGLAQPGPDPLPALAVLLFEIDQRLTGAGFRR